MEIKPSSSSSRHRSLGGGGGGHHVLDYLRRMQSENPAFFYAIQGDSVTGENHHPNGIGSGNGNIFWADANSRLNYTYFGDTVRLDTSYRANRNSRVPFAAFTGINHHGQPVLFGCALLYNESNASFVWLLQTWLQVMSGRCSMSITTDLDRYLQMAVAQVLPETRHRFCKFSVMRESQEKLGHIYQTQPTLEIEFHKCIDETETPEEFEACWESLMERYFLLDNEWLQSLYNARHQWVPVYLRDTFFGELVRTEGGDAAVNSFFDGYLNAATTIQLLIKQYEKAVAAWHEKELKADFDTTNTTSVLKTPSPMEKQAANLFTKRIFVKFQEELVETLANPATTIEESENITTYRVAKFGEEHRAHTVSFNAFDKKANCSCQMFEYTGIICRHVLSVFRAKNVLMLPSQYVLKRWTRNAKNGPTVEEPVPELPSNSRESSTVRYNNLRQEAIKFVEEGAKSIHIYNVAMDALQEAAKKVAAAKKKNSGTIQVGILANGRNGEMQGGEEDLATSHQSAEDKEKRIHELAAELDGTNQRCEVYRANLLAVLRDMEDQKLKLSVKVQNVRLGLKE